MSGVGIGFGMDPLHEKNLFLLRSSSCVDCGRMNSPQQSQREWPPTKYLAYEDSVGTNMSPAIVQTDAGRAYVKPMADDINPHGLAIELICTRLAEWFGLRVLDTCVLVLGKADTFPRIRPTSLGGPAKLSLPGPCVCTRSVVATRWDGSEGQLAKILNIEDIAPLVVFDTWVRNDDRFPPVNTRGELQSSWSRNLGNVLLVRDPPKARKLVLYAIDFGRAVIGERSVPSHGFGIEQDKSENIYGLFPEFRKYVTPERVEKAVRRLRSLDRTTIEEVIQEVPPEWELSGSARTSLLDHLYRRASFLADTIQTRLAPLCYPQGRMLGW